MPIPNPVHLLEQADRLISPPRGGAPRQTDLRRAISSAYYAVFHAVIAEAADSVVGRTHRESPRYALAYRSGDHRALMKLCDDIRKTTLPKRYDNYSPKDGFGADLVALATAVADLQEKRHSAEYDPLFRVSSSDAVSAVATARVALQRFGSASRASKKDFLFLLIFSSR
jgi:hypothetical protein